MQELAGRPVIDRHRNTGSDVAGRPPVSAERVHRQCCSGERGQRIAATIDPTLERHSDCDTNLVGADLTGQSLQKRRWRRIDTEGTTNGFGCIANDRISVTRVGHQTRLSTSYDRAHMPLCACCSAISVTAGIPIYALTRTV
jgi:hypothetical protein